MNKFYIFWFFFCAGWGYLASQPLGDIAFSISQAPATFLSGAISFFILFAFEIIRAGKTKRHRPSLALKPWESYPVGLVTFILITFFFSSIWGFIFALVVNGVITTPIIMLSMVLGISFGGWCVLFLFKDRFHA